MQSAKRLVYVTPLMAAGTGANCTLEFDPKYSVSDRIRRTHEDPYYAHEGRLFEHLLLRGLDPMAAPADASLQATDLHRLLSVGGVLRHGQPGYDHATCVAGAAVEVKDENGTASLVLGLHGQQVSNDHYPYYEATFRRGDGTWQLQRVQTFFYDVAGIEGAEWPVLHGFFAIVAFGCVAVLALPYSALRRLRRSKAAEQRDGADERRPG